MLTKITIKFWHFGIFATLILSGFLSYNLLEGDKSYFLTGQTSHGHYQIELACNSCHVEAFAEKDDMQNACENCHAKELDAFSDSHPKKKFMDPRNAELIKDLDPRYCVSCHTEHKPELTRKSGVTIAKDFCFHCHQSIAEERESHASFAFDSCATSGCHNYHDNSALYEKFFMKHINTPDLKKKPRLRQRNAALRWLKKNPDVTALSIEQQNGGWIQHTSDDILNSWANSIHATTAVNCNSCHAPGDKKNPNLESIHTCESCHKKQVSSFTQGMHGMRVALDLSKMSPASARLNMQPHADKLLDCASCHDPHSLNVNEAAVESCLGCHNDTHSTNYKKTKHHQLWVKEQQGIVPEGSGVTCATCHLPRIRKGKKISIEHNQNANLRPNSKMLKTVCMNCHGLKFSLNSLADEILIKNNFSGLPSQEIETFELIRNRIEQRKKQREERKQKAKLNQQN